MPGIGLDYVSLTAEQERSFLCRNQQQGFQMAEKLVGAPVFREFDSGAAKVTVILLQLGLETAEQSESVGGGAGKSGKNLVLIEAANLLRSVLDDGFTERDLAVAGHDNFVVARERRGPWWSGFCGGREFSAVSSVAAATSGFFIMSAILDYSSGGSRQVAALKSRKCEREAVF